MNKIIELFRIRMFTNSLSDSNEKSTADDEDNSPTIATTLASLPNSNCNDNEYLIF